MTAEDFFRASGQDAETVVEEDPPRGRLDDGLVRTTGWLRLGGATISSGLVAAAAGLLVAVVPAMVLPAGAPLAGAACVVGGPVLGFVLWFVTVRWLAPASPACNTGTAPAEALRPDQWVRLYGRHGPIGQIAGVTTEDDAVDVEFTGGVTTTWPAAHEVHLAELR